MIKEKELPKAVVNNKLITRKATDLTIMSYDKNVHKLIIPTDLTQDKINDIIVLITFRYHDNIIQISGDLVEDKIEIILPNEIRSLRGEFYIEIDINLTDNRQITFARYRANVVKSDIDSVDLDDAQEFYFELFDDFVQKVADKSDIAVAEIDAHKQSVSDKADTAITVITDANNSVTTAKQSALTSITQATSDVTDASTQFTADLANTLSTIDAQVAQANLDLAEDLAEVDNTIANINTKSTQVDTLHSDFTADVATKQSDVTSKYNAFDTSVTQANQTIDEILALQGDVSDIKQKVSNQSKIYGVKFTGSNAAGVRTHDAVGMVANVGVNDQLVQNDFDNVSFYKRQRCLVYHDPSGKVRVMAYEGEPGFSLQGAIFAPYTEKAQVFYEQAPFYWNGDLDWPQVTATPLEGFELAPMFKNPTDKVYLPSYWLGLDNGKACSLSGVHPEYNSVNGSMTTARTYHARAHLETMDARMSEYVLQLVEFATRDVQNVMTGAMSNRYNADDISILAEESTNRIVMANASADQYAVGQTICIGTTKNGSNIATRVVITSIDVYDASNKAITFDGPPLNIPVGAFTSSRAWRNGATDIVKASSGSPVSNSNGRYPCIWRSKVDPWAMAFSGISDVLIQRIGTGTPEDPYIYNAYKLKDPTLYNNGAIDDNWIKVDYNLSPSDGYVTQMGKDPKNPSVRMPIAVGGASATYYAAYYYFGRYAVSAVFVGGHWTFGRYCSPVFFFLGDAPSNSSLDRLARLFVSPV